MKHYFNARVRVILIVAIVLAVVLAVITNLTGMSIPDMVVKGILTPVRTGVSHLTDQAEQFYSYMFEYESLAAENEQLRQQLAELEDKARQADSIARENDQLRDLLGLTQANEDYVLVDSYIIGWSSSDFSNTFTINRGTSSGIDVNMVAITANGEVVGLVTEAGANYAIVKTVLDSTLEISATIASSGYNGMVSGGYISGQETLLRMNYLPSSSIIRNKDQVVTSGSTVYPQDQTPGVHGGDLRFHRVPPGSDPGLCGGRRL